MLIVIPSLEAESADARLRTNKALILALVQDCSLATIAFEGAIASLFGELEGLPRCFLLILQFIHPILHFLYLFHFFVLFGGGFEILQRIPSPILSTQWT